MLLFEPPENKLMTAIESGHQQVYLNHIVGPLENIFRRAFEKDRRLLAYMVSYEASAMRTKAIQLMYDYTVTIHYSKYRSLSLNDIIIDSDSLDVSCFMTKGRFKDRVIVTDDFESLHKKFMTYVGDVCALYEGFYGFNFEKTEFDKLSKDTVAYVSLICMIDNESKLRQMQAKTMFRCKEIWRRILGNAKVPKFVLPFLAFSWITQECIYDQRAYDEVEADPNGTPSDPVPFLGYGPLVENRGICGGFAWAFKCLMDSVNVECICIPGFLKEDMKVGHQWDLVKIGEQYYHVDPTWGSKSSGVNVEKFMQPDSAMKTTHIWDESKYPKATGIRIDYGYLEDYLAENGSEFLDDGAEEKYMFPNEIID